jgi:hypothetical protein
MLPFHCKVKWQEKALLTKDFLIKIFVYKVHYFIFSGSSDLDSATDPRHERRAWQNITK